MAVRESAGKPCLQVLDEVIKALVDLRVKLASDSFLQNVWASDGPIKPEILFQSKAEFDNGCKSLRTLKDLADVLAPLYRPVSEKIWEIRNALLRPSSYYGLASLPNEIFMRIMDFLAASCTTYGDRLKLIKNLSSVSKRFRDGVVNTTSFWIYWDTGYCLDDGFQHRMVRAREAPLFVDINATLDKTRVKKVFTRILPHRNRWHHFRLDASDVFEWLTSIFPNTDFPSVCSLEVDVSAEDFDETEFSDWTFPNVSSVKVFEIIPPPGAFPKATSLTICNKIGDFGLTGLYLPRLTKSLPTMPALSTLDLDVSLIHILSGENESPTVELPSVTTFRVGNCRDLSYLTDDDDVFAPVTCVGQITRALKLPNVERYTLGLCIQENEEEAWLPELFPKGVSFRSVKDFHLIVTSTVPESFTLFFDGFSSRFPNLHSLHVDRFRHKYGGLGDGSFHLAETFDIHEGRLPHLRSLVVLELDNDWSVFSKWFKDLREKGAAIDHLSISNIWGIVDLQLIQSLKRDNVNVKFLPRIRSPSPSVEGSEESEEGGCSG